MLHRARLLTFLFTLMLACLAVGSGARAEMHHGHGDHAKQMASVSTKEASARPEALTNNRIFDQLSVSPCDMTDMDTDDSCADCFDQPFLSSAAAVTRAGIVPKIWRPVSVVPAIVAENSLAHLPGIRPWRQPILNHFPFGSGQEGALLTTARLRI